MQSPAAPLTPDVRAEQFPVTAEVAYLNTATMGPLATRTARAVEETLARSRMPGVPGAQPFDTVTEVARHRLARLMGAQPDDLVFTANTTHGLNICAHGIAWRPGDNVVLPVREFPSVERAWGNLRADGVEVRAVEYDGVGPDVDTLMAACDSRTRAVACSAVAWDTGFRVDLEALAARCRKIGALLVVDGIQLIGAAPADVRALGVSAISTHGYKWLAAGFGVGALYVAPDAVDQIRPRFVAEHSFDGEGEDAGWKPGARRYAVGGSNYLGLAALAESLAMIEGIGMDAVGRHNRALGEALVAGLRRIPGVELVSPEDPERRAAIVVFTLGSPERDAELAARLERAGISVALRRRGVRVSPHFYNTHEEVERLLRALAE